jgi:phenylalanyl-tRNA synthetase beta subunit
VAEVEVERIIRESAGPLLEQGPFLFDTFNKDNRKSLAFRLVLQSDERTLSDQEAGDVMAGVVAALELNSGWEVRK